MEVYCKYVSCKEMQLLTISLHYAKTDCSSIWCKEFSIISAGCCVVCTFEFWHQHSSFSPPTSTDIFFQLGQSLNTCIPFEHMNDWKIRLQGKIFWQNNNNTATQKQFSMVYTSICGLFSFEMSVPKETWLRALCATLQSSSAIARNRNRAHRKHKTVISSPSSR